MPRKHDAGKVGITHLLSRPGHVALGDLAGPARSRTTGRVRVGLGLVTAPDVAHLKDLTETLLVGSTEDPLAGSIHIGRPYGALDAQGVAVAQILSEHDPAHNPV